MKKMAIFKDLDILDVSANIEPYVYPIQSHENRLLLKETKTFLSSLVILNQSEQERILPTTTYK